MADLLQNGGRFGSEYAAGDQKYLEAAAGGRVQALVSGDKDLAVLKVIEGIRAGREKKANRYYVPGLSSHSHAGTHFA